MICGRVPLDSLAFLRVVVEFHVTLGNTILNSFVAVDDPELDGRVVRSRCEELVLEWVPLQVVDRASMTLDKWDCLVESLIVVRAKYRN